MSDSNGKYSTLKVGVQANPHHRMEIPDGAWVKCKECGRTLYRDQLAENLYVCTYCACHLAMSMSGRIRLLTDANSFQEIDITGVTLPITKHNFFVSKIEDLADTVREAFLIAKSGRPGPVLVDIPKDVQLATYEYEPQPIVEKIPL